MTEDIKPLKLGKYRFKSNRKGLIKKVIHIRALVDGYHVCREWSKVSQSWRYFLETPYYFWLNRDELTFIGKNDEW